MGRLLARQSVLFSQPASSHAFSMQTTKLWNSDHGYQQTLQAFQKSLVNLGLEYGEPSLPRPSPI